MRSLVGPNWIGRLLLGAVAFWWAGVLAPNVLGVAFSKRIPQSSLPAWTDPVNEASAANLVSAAALLTMALLAFRAAMPSTPGGWLATGGWAALGITGVFLA